MHRYLFEPSNAQLIALDGQVLKGNDTTLFYERSGSGKFDVAAPVDNSCKFGGGGLNASPTAVAKAFSAFYATRLTRPNVLAGCVSAESISLGGEGLGGRSALVAYPADRLVVVILANARGGDLVQHAMDLAEVVRNVLPKQD